MGTANFCTKYLIENGENIDVDKHLNYIDLIYDKCFDNHLFARHAYKHIILSCIRPKIHDYNIIDRLTHCFTIPQLYHIYKNRTEELFPHHYYDYAIDDIKKHNSSKKLFSYRYYLKRMIYNVGSATYILDYASSYMRETFGSFNINILKLAYYKIREVEFRWIGVRFVNNLLFKNISFKQIKRSIPAIMENHILLNDTIKENKYDYEMEDVPNILFLKYILKYHSDISENIFSGIAQRNVKVAIFVENYYPKSNFGLCMNNIRFCEYLIRSKKDNKKTPIFDLIKKILEKFSTKNICKMILYF